MVAQDVDEHKEPNQQTHQEDAEDPYNDRPSKP
jgi:hypothetical protein